MKRVFGVIDSHLKKSGKPYLMGDKVTYVDLMFVPWNRIIFFMLGADYPAEFEKELPHITAWKKKLEDRESVKKVNADVEKAKAEKEGGH